MAGSISTLGIGSGLDLQGILDQLRAVDQTRIINLETRQLQYKDQLAELETVNSMLLSVKSLAFDLSLNSTFETNQVASSDETVLTATVDDTAAASTMEMTVGSLAKQNVWQSDGVAAANTSIAAAAGEFDYTVDGTTYTVSVTAGMTSRNRPMPSMMTRTTRASPPRLWTTVPEGSPISTW
jgi:flagellar hook-associated protein 2